MRILPRYAAACLVAMTAAFAGLTDSDLNRSRRDLPYQIRGQTDSDLNRSRRDLPYQIRGQSSNGWLGIFGRSV